MTCCGFIASRHTTSCLAASAEASRANRDRGEKERKALPRRAGGGGGYASSASSCVSSVPSSAHDDPSALRSVISTCPSRLLILHPDPPRRVLPPSRPACHGAAQAAASTPHPEAPRDGGGQNLESAARVNNAA